MAPSKIRDENTVIDDMPITDEHKELLRELVQITPALIAERWTKLVLVGYHEGFADGYEYGSEDDTNEEDKP